MPFIDKTVPSFVQFWHDDQGAVTVDWVVLSAALVGLGFAVSLVVMTGVNDSTNSLTSELEGMESGFSVNADGDIVFIRQD